MKYTYQLYVNNEAVTSYPSYLQAYLAAREVHHLHGHDVAVVNQLTGEVHYSITTKHKVTEIWDNGATYQIIEVLD